MLNTIKGIVAERAREEHDQLVFGSAFENKVVSEAFLDQMDSEECVTEATKDDEDAAIDKIIEELPDDFDEDEDIKKIISSEEDLTIEELDNI